MEQTHAKKAYWLIVLIIILAVAAAALLWQLNRYDQVLVAEPEVQGAATTTDATWNTYANPTFGYEIKYPKDFVQGGTDEKITFTLPVSYTEGTNLSADSTVSIEVASSTLCAPTLFLDSTTSESMRVQRGNILYTTASTTGAAAGNRYDTIAYTTGNPQECIGIVLNLHSTVLENYEPGTKVEFKRAEIMAIFDQMVASFTFAK